MNVDFGRLRRLAFAVQAGAGELYGLDWRATQLSDEFGVSPRVHIGGTFSTYIRMGCWSPQQAPTMQTLANYLAMLTPEMVLDILNLIERADGKEG